MAQQKQPNDLDHILKQMVLHDGDGLTEDQKNMLCPSHDGGPGDDEPETKIIQPVVEGAPPEKYALFFGAKVNVTAAEAYAARKTVEALYIKNYKLKMKQLDDCGDPEVQKLIQENTEMESKEEDGRVKEDQVYALITVNAKPGITWEDLLQGHKKLLSYVYIKDLLDLKATLEHRWENDQPTGPHIHYYIHRNPHPAVKDKNRQTPGVIRDAFKRAFKGLTEVDNPHCLNFHWGKVGTGFMLYVSGQKRDEEKGHRIEKDREFRKSHNIPDVMVRPTDANRK